MILNDVKDLKGRRGTVRVDVSMIRETLAGDQEARAAWNAVFSEFVVVHAEYKFGGLSIEYTGHHPAFEVIPEGFMEPTYEVTIERQYEDAGTVSFWPKWNRIK